MLLAKSKLNNIEILMSKALINFSISHDDFFFSKWCIKLMECDGMIWKKK